jgi:hypothetical protein
VQRLFGSSQSNAATVVEQDRDTRDVQLVPLGGFDASGLPILDVDHPQSAPSLSLIDLPLLTADADPPRHPARCSGLFALENELPCAVQPARHVDAASGFDPGEGSEWPDSPMCGLSAERAPETAAYQRDGSEMADQPQEPAPIMVPCLDDNDVPDVMAYATDTPVIEESFLEFWTRLFHRRAAPIAGIVEEAESIIPATKPECREDPNHPYQDAGCPFMRFCPSGRCLSPEPAQPIPKTDAEPQEPRMDVNALELLHHRVLYMMDPVSAQAQPVHPDIDTMEFRPSDANIKAFENWQKNLPL